VCEQTEHKITLFHWCATALYSEPVRLLDWKGVRQNVAAAVNYSINPTFIIFFLSFEDMMNYKQFQR